MDKRKSILNVSVSIFSRILLLAAALYVRRLLITHIGNDINGLNSLYSNIIGMLSVAEFGVGSAIVFSMYRPIVTGNKRKVAALYCLYRKWYKIIATVILAAGLIVMPFLPRLINDYEHLDVNVYGTFLLSLASVVLSYLYSARISLIEAHRDNYITTGILACCSLIRYGMQIAAILIWKSYVIFLICQIIDTVMVWGIMEALVRHRHGDIIKLHETADPETKTEVRLNVKAMFMHRIGTVMVSTIDNLIISGYIGVVVLGKFTNYTFIAGIVSGTIALFFSPLTSTVGHLCVSEDPDKREETFKLFYCMNYVLGVVFFLGYFSVIDDLIFLFFGPDLEMSRSIVFIITLNSFTQYMRKTLLLFRNASGSFYYDRWKAVGEGIVNLGLSLLFVNVFPENYRVVGVIVATIITTLLICYTVEPYVVFHHVFGKSPRMFYLRHYSYIGLFTAFLVLLARIRQPRTGTFQGILINGLISVGVSAAAIVVLMLADRYFRNEIRTMIRILLHRGWKHFRFK